MKKQSIQFAVCLSVLFAANARAQNLVSSVVKAGIAVDGDVAGAPSDFLINLNVLMDASEGLSLLSGRTIKITVPPEFVDTGVHEAVTAFSSKTCTPGALECNTGALIQGWPQRPVLNTFPPVTLASENTTGDPVVTFSMQKNADGSHTFTHTAEIDVVPGLPAPGPGIKQLHMILPGFQNPTTPGDYTIDVSAETGTDGAVQTGSAVLNIRPEIAPSINLTSVYDSMRRNTVYQQVNSVDDVVPYGFWLWDGQGEAMLDVDIVGNQLVQQGEVVGEISIAAPDGATGQTLVSLSPSVAATEPFFGIATGRFEARLIPGDLPGDYVTTIRMLNGNSQSMTVNLVPEPSSQIQLFIFGILGLVMRRKLLPGGR